MNDLEEISVALARFCNVAQGALDHAHNEIEGALTAFAEAIRTQTAQQEKDRGELGRLRAALAWYADTANYGPGHAPGAWKEGDFWLDYGTRARAALAGREGEGKE